MCAETVHLHVGVAKTGTTYLQRVLFDNRNSLKANGFLYPGQGSAAHYLASVDLRSLDTPQYHHMDYRGRWDALAADVRAFPGPQALISHETLARSRAKEIERAVSSFGAADVRVVLTVRDLGRQIPAVWQEMMKNRQTESYAQFLEDVFVRDDSAAHAFFWRPQDLTKVIRRWGKQVGMDHVTVVTVPPPGAPKDELLSRFARAVGMPDIDLTEPQASNASLGPAEAEILRQLNLALPESFPWQRYLRVVKRNFAEGRMSHRAMGKIVLPPRWHDQTRERAAQMQAAIERFGCPVIGDLSDLDPQLPVQEISGPDDLSRDELMGVAGEIVRDLLLANNANLDRLQRFQQEGSGGRGGRWVDGVKRVARKVARRG